MGIQGLLPLLKSIHRPSELKKYAGETLGVDAYGWLHRGTVSCAIELAQGKPTRKYVDFVMSRVRMAQHFGVTPYLVFDGDYLPSKALTEAGREKRREESRKAGLELLKAGKPSQAHAELQKAVDVTPEMARHLIEELKKADVPYVVAPYEADAQLVYLERCGLTTGIISEDSDLLVFGAKRLLTKLDQHGQCVEINRRDFCACREVTLTGWTDAQFRQMAILSGCDYLDSINNLGLKTAHCLLRIHKTADRVLRMLQFDGKYRVPADYLSLFHQAEQTFLYQWVYCPNTHKLVHLTEPGPEIDVSQMPFIGSFVEPQEAQGIACGDLNPITKQTIVLPSLPSPRKRTASAANRTMAPPPPPPQQPRSAPRKPIDSHFNGHRRIPMGEMEPNCFTVDPARVASLTENGSQPIVFPLPRPYLDEGNSNLRNNNRSYINRPERNDPPRTLRRRTEPISNLLSNNGRNLVSSSRRQTAGPDFGNSDHSGAGMGQSAPPVKKLRLCDDQESATKSAKNPEQQRSKFFPSQTKHGSTKKTDAYLLSDDSIEEALRELPDMDGWHTTSKRQSAITVYDGRQDDQPVASHDNDVSDPSSQYSSNSSAGSTNRTGTETDLSQPGTPSRDLISLFPYAPRRTSTISQKSQSSRRGSTASSVRNSLLALTPAESRRTSVSASTPFSSISQPSTTQTTPATPRLTPLQRLGVQALNSQRQSPTTRLPAPRQPQRSSSYRRSIDSLPVNPQFIPLPPVDAAEAEALNQPLGSEDLLIPDSEGEEVSEDVENMGRGKERNQGGGTTMDLSRFLFA
ncbi:hypothetical protein F4778DRAFT_691730 [Xylariomycetidae sp. FL2044]|nr:hypothetical protein F4778DRAFT_691730 [Xylariomycetidae sp. FL2044]